MVTQSQMGYMQRLQDEVDTKLLEIRSDRKVRPQDELLQICTTLVGQHERTKASSSVEEHNEEPVTYRYQNAA